MADLTRVLHFASEFTLYESAKKPSGEEVLTYQEPTVPRTTRTPPAVSSRSEVELPDEAISPAQDQQDVEIAIARLKAHNQAEAENPRPEVETLSFSSPFAKKMREKASGPWLPDWYVNRTGKPSTP